MKKIKQKKERKEMKDSTRIGLFIGVIIAVIALIGGSCYFVLMDKKDTKSENEELKKNVNVIDGYDITVDDLDSAYYKSEFEKLKKNLTSDNIDKDEYAKSVAKMFIIDLYTIDTKVNKYDVGGIEFVLPDAQENYITNVTDTMYKYIEDNSDNSRVSSLPVVSNVEITKTEKSKYKIESENKEYDSYIFTIKITYEKDLEYDKEAEVIVINKDDKMYVVEKN